VPALHRHGGDLRQAAWRGTTLRLWQGSQPGDSSSRHVYQCHDRLIAVPLVAA